MVRRRRGSAVQPIAVIRPPSGRGARARETVKFLAIFGSVWKLLEVLLFHYFRIYSLYFNGLRGV
jgi:hypothetical protein